MNRVNLQVLIDQLEVMVEKAPEVPLVGKVLIDADELFELLDVIRTAIPEEVKRAEAVSSEKDRMLAAGQQQAEQLVAKAEEYATNLVRTSEIYRQAEEESKVMIEQARLRAREIEVGAKEYADQIFSNLHDALTKTLHVVELSKTELKKD